MESIRSLAGLLNQSCACYLLDTEALHRSLQADSVLSSWWPQWQTTHAHLFSATGIFISQHELQAMQEAVQLLHEVMTSPAWHQHALAAEPALQRAGPRGVFMGYDFHLTESGPKLIEINTNAGGAMLNALLLKAHGRQTEAAALEAAIVAMFRAEWAAARGDVPLTRIAIVDEQPASQYLAPEFQLFKQLFEAHGIAAVVADPAELVRAGDALCSRST